jgi:hypothetical protein
MVNVLNFDENGYLTPYDVIVTDIETLRSTFVFNSHREKIFDSYLLFLDNLRELDIGNFFQWVDGSFTTRKIFPKDIDIITFIDIDTFKVKKSRLYYLSGQFARIDSYFVEMYKPNNPFYTRNEWEKNHWKDIYGSTKDDGINPVFEKGITQINFL